MWEGGCSLTCSSHNMYWTVQVGACVLASRGRVRGGRSNDALPASGLRSLLLDRCCALLTWSSRRAFATSSVPSPHKDSLAWARMVRASVCRCREQRPQHRAQAGAPARRQSSADRVHIHLLRAAAEAATTGEAYSPPLDAAARARQCARRSISRDFLSATSSVRHTDPPPAGTLRAATRAKPRRPRQRR